MSSGPGYSTLQRAELRDGTGRDAGQAIPGHPGKVGAGAKLQEHGTARLTKTAEACVPSDRLSGLACKRLDGPRAAEDGCAVDASQNGDEWSHKGALFEPAMHGLGGRSHQRSVRCDVDRERRHASP